MVLCYGHSLLATDICLGLCYEIMSANTYNNKLCLPFLVPLS